MLLGQPHFCKLFLTQKAVPRSPCGPAGQQCGGAVPKGLSQALATGHTLSLTRGKQVGGWERRLQGLEQLLMPGSRVLSLPVW